MGTTALADAAASSATGESKKAPEEASPQDLEILKQAAEIAIRLGWSERDVKIIRKALPSEVPAHVSLAALQGVESKAGFA